MGVMITQTGKYALRILGYLIEHGGERVQGRAIADETGIPANYLSKILNQLRKHGYVESQKGWGGGFLLAESAAGKPIGEVLEAIEGPRERDRCLLEPHRCDPTHPCALHEPWERARQIFEEMLDRVRVEDLRGRRAG
jgi:Rrf2 family protein